jgi:hypothetical protein
MKIGGDINQCTPQLSKKLHLWFRYFILWACFSDGSLIRVTYLIGLSSKFVKCPGIPRGDQEWYILLTIIWLYKRSSICLFSGLAEVYSVWLLSNSKTPYAKHYFLKYSTDYKKITHLSLHKSLDYIMNEALNWGVILWLC